MKKRLSLHPGEGPSHMSILDMKIEAARKRGSVGPWDTWDRLTVSSCLGQQDISR